MADTITITFDLVKPIRVGAYGKVGMITGQANLTSYSQTKAALTSITGLFVRAVRVTPQPSSLGYVTRWDDTSSCFRAYGNTSVASGATGALVECSNTTSVGTFDFVAIGQIAG